MAGLTKHYRALDYVIAAMDCLRQSQPVKAAAHLQKSLQCHDFEEALAALDETCEQHFVAASTKKSAPMLEQALAIVAKNVKDKKSKAMKAMKDKKFKKKKAKAGVDQGLVIAEVDVEELELTEDDLLDSGDDELAEMEDGDDLDLDALSLDDDDAEIAGDEATDLDLDDDGVLDMDEDVEEMPEATSAEALGTDADIKSGKDGAPKVSDHGEPPTEVKKAAVPSTASKLEVKAAQRLLKNVQVLEAQAKASKPRAGK